MQGDGKGEGPMRDLRGFEAGAVDSVDHPAQDKYLADEESAVHGGLLQVDDAGPTEVRSELSLDGCRIDVDADAPCTDAERAAVEVGIPRKRTNRIEVAGGHFLADDVREAQPVNRPLDRSGRIEPEHLRIEHRGANLHPLRGECGEGLGARQGRMLPRQLDRKSTRLNSSHRTISYAV